VAAGASVRFRSSAVADLSLSGKISFVGQVIDEKTRTITVRAVFDNNGGLLKPQMFGEMDIASDKKTTAIVIPAEAVVKMDNTDIVFVKKTESEFEKRAVTVAASRNDSVEIDGGIADGENVVVRGAFYLKAELLKGSLGEGE
jgi:cobalt-zinc-cadmium efflux system membrane fusion protein